MGMIIGAVLCAIAASKVAESKGRSILGWFVLGALFGIFALIVVACLRSPKLDETLRGRNRYEQFGDFVAGRDVLR